MKVYFFKLIIIFFSTLFSYLIFEISYSLLKINHYFDVKTIWFHESTDPIQNIKFDKDVGYKISNIPSRFGAVTTDGELCSVGNMAGNNFGFPDSRDFSITKKGSIKRIAVLGDSFTASQFTKTNWLNILEKKVNDNFLDSVVFMNFSVDGGGLGNWQSIVDNIIIKNNFEIDALVFAVLGDDLERKFMWKDDGLKKEQRKLAAGMSESWNQKLKPQTIDELDAFFLDDYVILSAQEVDKIEKGEWHFQIPLKFYLFEKIKNIIQNKIGNVQEAKASSEEIEKAKLISSLNKSCKKMNIPILCISMLSDENEVENFSTKISADFISDKPYNEAMASVSYDTNIKGDGHWNEKGTELFANSMYEDIVEWLKDKQIIQN